MGRYKDIKDQRFGKLVAVERTDRKKHSSSVWRCVCDCGKESFVPINYLMNGDTKSCGCEDRRGTHNMIGTPTYRSWVKMLQRVRTDAYGEWYSDVGVCPEWDTEQGGSFENFFEDMGERPNGCTLNRIRGAKVYSKENCEWATISVQSFDQRRKRTNTSGRTGVRWREERQVWEARISVDYQQIILYYGPSFEEAVKAREAAEIEYYGFNKE